MNNLIRVAWHRMVRDRLFYFAIAITMALTAYVIFDNGPTTAQWAAAGEDYELEDCYFNLFPLLGMIFGAYVSLFLGTEHSDGILRNKVIAGNSKAGVYLSLFLVAAAGCLILTAAALLAGMTGLIYFDGFAFGWRMYFLYVLTACCTAITLAAIYTIISMLTSNKAQGAVIALVLWFILLFAGSAVVNLLSAPEMTADYSLIEGAWVEGAPYPNPDYVTGIRRIVLEIFSYLNPVCIQIRMSDSCLLHPVAAILSSLGMSIAALLAGCTAFTKKDLK